MARSLPWSNGVKQSLRHHGSIQPVAHDPSS